MNVRLPVLKSMGGMDSFRKCFLAVVLSFLLFLLESRQAIAKPALSRGLGIGWTFAWKATGQNSRVLCRSNIVYCRVPWPVALGSLKATFPERIQNRELQVCCKTLSQLYHNTRQDRPCCMILHFFPGFKAWRKRCCFCKVVCKASYLGPNFLDSVDAKASRPKVPCCNAVQIHPQQDPGQFTEIAKFQLPMISNLQESGCSSWPAAEHLFFWGGGGGGASLCSSVSSTLSIYERSRD